MAWISGSSTPFLNSLTGGSRRPSCSTAVADAEKPPGTEPPMSGQWPVFDSQQNISAGAVDRHGEAHVHQMRAAEIGIVDDVDVAGLAAAGSGRPLIISISVLVEYCMTPTKTGRPPAPCAISEPSTAE